MAIRFKEMKEQLETAPLTTEELSAIKEVEDYVDSEIKKQFGNTYGVSIDLNIADFSYNIGITKQLNFKQARKKLMQKELERRYKAAGWSIKTSYDDGLDGPNMSGPDYWILNGK